jgi:hypothetical protein
MPEATPCGGGSNTSNVALGVLRGNGKGPSAWISNWSTLLLGIYIQIPGLPGWGVSNLRKYMVTSPAGLGPKNDCADEYQQQL